METPIVLIALFVHIISFVIAFVALYFMQETFAKDLDYLEQ